LPAIVLATGRSPGSVSIKTRELILAGVIPKRHRRLPATGR
jgi:hypothetical protein